MYAVIIMPIACSTDMFVTLLARSFMLANVSHTCCIAWHARRHLTACANVYDVIVFVLTCPQPIRMGGVLQTNWGCIQCWGAKGRAASNHA